MRTSVLHSTFPNVSNAFIRPTHVHVFNDFKLSLQLNQLGFYNVFTSLSGVMHTGSHFSPTGVGCQWLLMFCLLPSPLVLCLQFLVSLMDMALFMTDFQCHVTCGRGTPVTLQDNVTVSPS